MELEHLLQTKKFLEEISVSIRNIILANFPEMSREEKEDIDHEVKFKLWKKLAAGKKIDNLRSYLWKVVYTTALDIIGERMNYLPLEQLVETARRETLSSREVIAPDCPVEEKELKLLLEKAMNVLPERRKTVLQLHFSGMDLKHIAASLHWRENQVRHLLYRGLNDLREKIKEWKNR
jgi:RNA polymerase sigma-70 factor (ECF subfamily)